MPKCPIGDCTESFRSKKDLKEHKRKDHTS